MLHSRLLRFILPGNNNINKMAESPKLFDYQNPNNLESEVPGAQTIREPQTNENAAENAANTTENEKASNENKRHIIRSYTQVIEDEKVIKHNQVITGDRNETRTKIPVSRFRQTVEKVKAERRGSKDKEHESHIPVRRTSIPKPKRTKMTKNELTIKTEAPKDAEDEFDKIYAEIVVNTPTEVNIDILNPKVDNPEELESTFEEIIHDYDEHRVEPIDVEVVRRSKIPFLKRRSQQEIETQNERTSKIIAARDKLRQRHSLTKGEDFETELDRELEKSQNNNDNNTSHNVNSKYNTKDEPKNPNNTKTEKEFKHEIISSPNTKVDIKKEVTKTISTGSDTDNTESSSLVETTTVKEVTTNETIDKSYKKQTLVEENIVKGSIRIPLFDSNVQETSENNESSKTVEVKRVLSYTKSGDLSPTTSKLNQDSKTFENHFTREIDVSFTENKDVLEGAKIKKLDLRKDNVSTEAEEKEKAEAVNEEFKIEEVEDAPKETNEEDIIQIRGKVERIISKIDSKEILEIDGNQRESINELRKKKSVLSKIAMFERTELESPAKTGIPQKEINLPKLMTKELNKDHIHVHTPLIVDEVFKFQKEINLNKEGNEVEIQKNLKKYEVTEIDANDTDPVLYAVQNKLQVESTEEENTYESKHMKVNVQSKIDFNNTSHKAGIATITDITTSNKELNMFSNGELGIDEPIIKEIKKMKEYDDRFDGSKEELQSNDTIYKENDPITPGYKTVSELLKSFESKTATRNLTTKRHFSREFSIKQTETPLSTAEENQTQSNYIMDISREFNKDNEPNNIEISNNYNHFESINEYKSLDDVFTSDIDMKTLKLRQEDDFKRAKSLADLGPLNEAVKGKVNNVIRMISVDRIENRKEKISIKEMPRKRSVSEKIALFEGKVTPSRAESANLRIFRQANLPEAPRTEKKIEAPTKINKFDTKDVIDNNGKDNIIIENRKQNIVSKEVAVENDEEKIKTVIEDLKNAKTKYGKIDRMPVLELSNEMTMPALAVGTAMLDSRIIYHVITAAIDLGYRAIDTAFIYGNEEQVGNAIRAKIEDGTVKREDLFIISKLWSTYHKKELVEDACRASLARLNLEYVDLYLIHNPMSFKEGAGPIPKIATVLQYSESDYLDAWYGMETLVAKGLARSIGVSNFNSVQLQRVLDKGRIKPVVNQVECHPYLTQQRLDTFCTERNVMLSCFGVLGSKGTPAAYKNGTAAVIDDALVQVMASGLSMTPAQMLIRYQLENNRNVVVKSSSAAHLWDNLQAVNLRLTTVEVDALNALNRNRRTFIFKGMGDTHKNYPFNIPF